MKGWRNTRPNRELQRLEQQRIALKDLADYLMECCEKKTAEPSSTKKRIEVLFEEMAKINEAIRYCGQPVHVWSHMDLALVKSLIRHVIKIVTWYGHLRDTFAGKILAAFQKYFPLTRNLEIFYRQKCRAGVRTKLLFLAIAITQLHIGSRKTNTDPWTGWVGWVGWVGGRVGRVGRGIWDLE